MDLFDSHGLATTQVIPLEDTIVSHRRPWSRPAPATPEASFDDGKVSQCFLVGRSKNGPIETAHQQGFRVGECAQPQAAVGSLISFKLPRAAPRINLLFHSMKVGKPGRS